MTGTPPPGRHPVVTYALIAVCWLVFLFSPASGLLPADVSPDALYRAQAAYFRTWGVLPAELWADPAAHLLTPLTAMFVHGNWLHLMGNTLFLYVFGEMTEQRLGHVRFALFYLLVGYAAMLCYAAAHPSSEETLVGASGAIAGVLGAFLYLFPRARVTSVFPFLWFVPLRLPAWMVLVFWLGLQWAAARGDTDGPGVAYLAHVAGFMLGFLHVWARYRGDRVSRASVPVDEGTPE